MTPDLSKTAKMKRVLIITYYWPPSGGGGVMRWLKMSRYLPEFGWQPVIYTPENPDPSVLDESLTREVAPETEIIRRPIWEPYDWYRKLTGKPKGEKFKAGYISEASRGSWKEKLSVFIRGNLLIPDPRVFWVKPSIRFLKNYLKENPVDLVVSTGPPHSMHLIGLGLKRKLGIPWLADFRDPWTDIDFYHRLRLTRLADAIHHHLEKKVLASADFVTTVSPQICRSMETIAGRKIELVNNGYDPEDFEFDTETADDGSFTISHFGAFNRDRNPAILWRVLRELSQEDPRFATDLKIQLIGQTDETILQDIREAGLEKQLTVIPHKKHREGLELLRHSKVLLLPINDAPNMLGILPGKMYEYLALQRPIVAIGPPEGDFAAIITETQSGMVHAFGDYPGLKKSINDLYLKFNEGTLSVNSGNYEKYSRRSLAQKIISIPFSAEKDDTPR